MKKNKKPIIIGVIIISIVLLVAGILLWYLDGEYSDCSAEIATMDSMEMSTSYISIDETDTGAIRITNISEKDIPSVRIFYKFHKSETKVLLGGITYTTKISDLKKGETREIVPSHYEKGASRIMMVRTYDTY